MDGLFMGKDLTIGMYPEKEKPEFWFKFDFKPKCADVPATRKLIYFDLIGFSGYEPIWVQRSMDV